MAFQDKLKELMTKKNMKAVDLARATGLSEAIMSDYLNGKKEPRGRQGVAISKALDVSLDTLWETGYDKKEQNITKDLEDLKDKFINNDFLEGGKLSESDIELFVAQVDLILNRVRAIDKVIKENKSLENSEDSK